MVFENIIIVEGFENTSIRISEENLYAGPMSIQDIEIFERNLELKGTPYVLAQFDTTMVVPSNPKAKMYKRGYGLFVNMRDASRIALGVDSILKNRV